MQAVILAAGMGKRLGHLTDDNTKCMLPVHNVTLIERMLAHLQKLDLNQIVLVIGYKGENVRRFIGETVGDIPIKYVENPVYDKTNNIYSLYLAKEYLMDDDTLLIESDLIIEEKILQRLVANPYPSLAVVAKYESWMDGTVVMLDDQDNITSFIPKKDFSFQEVSSYFKTVNIYKFSKAFSRSRYIPFLEAYSKALGNNEYYEQVLKVIAGLEKPEIKALRLRGEKWYEIDDIQDLNNAEIIFSTPTDELARYQNRTGGYWRFPELLDFSNLVNSFFPTTRLREEVKANFEVLQSTYPSSLDTNCAIAAKNFSINRNYVVVGNGTSELLNAYFTDHTLLTGMVIPTVKEDFKKLERESLIYFSPQNPHLSYTVHDLMEFFSENLIEQLILTNPDTTSGNYIPLSDLFILLDWAKAKNIRAIIDESFIDFSKAGQSGTLLHNAVLENYSNLIVIKSLSIPYGISGLQLGVAVSADTTVIASIKHQLPNYNINSFAEFYMQVFGKYEKDYVAACDQAREEKDSLYKELKKIDYLSVLSSEGLYFLCEVANEITASELTDVLLKKHHILIKDCTGTEGFDRKNYVRIAVRNRFDNTRLINALKSVLQAEILHSEYPSNY